eukprot:gene17066-18786_t
MGSSPSKTNIAKEQSSCSKISLTAAKNHQKEEKSLGPNGEDEESKPTTICNGHTGKNAQDDNITTDNVAQSENQKTTQSHSVTEEVPGKTSEDTSKDSPNDNKQIEEDLSKSKKQSVVYPNENPGETDPTLAIFVEKGEKLIAEVNEMSLSIEDLPQSYKTVKSLRELYHKARYDYGEDFCRTLLDSLLELNLVQCIRDGFRRVQEKYPHIFSEPSDNNFKPYPLKLILSDYDPPEASAACVWLKLNSTTLGITDLHERSRVLAGDQGLLAYLLTESLPALSEGNPSPATLRGRLLENSMGSIYNCSVSPSNFRHFDKVQAIDRLSSLRNTPNEKINMYYLFILGYLIDEKNNDLIVSSNDTIDKIIKFLKSAIKMKMRRYKGMSSTELARALKHIAVNDQNKKLIGSRGGLETLLKMLTVAKTDDERIYSCKAMWMLLFDEDNKNMFKEMDGINQIKAFSQCENRQLRKVVAGMLWELQTKEELAERTMSTTDLRQDESDDCRHLMISYQWDEQRTMLKVRDALKNEGYKVWMDVDKIGGSTLEAMAGGVENAAAVLVGVSRKYKLSNNCRSEAEYAFQLKKDIIPIMLEPQYQPDGWLGMVVGAKFWIDFTQRTKAKVDESISKLVKEIGDRGKPSGQDIAKAIDAIDMAVIEKKCNKDEVMKWTARQVKKWMSSQGLRESSIKKTILDNLTGKRLILLRELHDTSPDFYFNSLRADFGFADVMSLLDFTDALKNHLLTNH